MNSNLHPWLSPALGSLLALHRSQRLPHALLIESAEGLAEADLAQALAKALVCERSLQADQSASHLLVDGACGSCKQCLLVQAGSHTDIKSLEPEEKGKAIKVDAIRALVDFLQQSSFQGGYKVALISPAEAMNVNAANALLKTLEEPTPNTLIVLMAHEAGRLLPTIRSRCQVVSLHKPSIEQGLAWLMRDAAHEQASCERMLAMAHGSPLLAQSYLEDDALARFDAMLVDLAAVLKRQQSISEVAERWAADEALLRVTWLSIWAQALVKQAMLGARYLRLGEQADKMFDYLVSKNNPTQLLALEQDILAQRALLQGPSNPNKALLFESLLAKWRALMLKTLS